MKNRFNIVIIALVLLAMGCTKTEMSDTKEKAVAFQVGNYAPQTKADSYTSLVNETTYFSSVAFLHTAGDNEVQNFFGDGETITANDSENPSAWLPSLDYFWPKSAGSYINFVSWYDKNGAPTTKNENELEWKDRVIEFDDNIMWADMAWRYNQNTTSLVNNTNAGLTDAFGQDAVTEGVPTLFHHALAQVRFMSKLSKSSDADGKVTWAVTVTGISLAAVKNQGTLSMSNADPGSTQTKAWAVTNWAATTSTETIAPETTPIAVNLNSEAKEVLGYKSVLPQAITDDMVLTVNYSVTTTYNTNVKTVVEDATTSAKLSAFSGSIEAWEMNKRYTYTVIINPDTGIIKIIPVETDWIVESEYPINIE